MNKVITINLNGRAYQVEEEGYNKLRDYLQSAGEKLSNDPGKEEIMSDLEQAMAEKCDQYLQKNKTVVTNSDVESIISQLGPVQGQTSSAEASSDAAHESPKNTAEPKRLYRIAEGAMFRGVCTGLAAYWNVDVTFIRIGFVILVLITHGFGILLYLVMMIVIPPATTSAQKAAASGAPFTAQEFIDRARQEYEKFSNREDWKNWKREWKAKARQEKWEWRQQRRASWNPVSPFLGLLVAVLSILWLWGLVMIISRGMIFGWLLPATIPIWVIILIWLCVYSFVMWPLKAARWSMAYHDPDYHHHYHNGFAETVVWLAFIAIIIWAAWQYIPSSHHALEQARVWGQHLTQKLRIH